MTEDAEKLAEVLVHLGLVSGSQMELALADHEVSGMPLEEIVTVRGWVDFDTLYAVAPWLKPGSKIKPPWRLHEKDPPEPPPEEKKRPKTTESGKPGRKTSPGMKKPAEDKPAASTAPKSVPAAKPAATPSNGNVSPVKSDYNENLAKYREVIKQIVGKEVD